MSITKEQNADKARETAEKFTPAVQVLGFMFTTEIDKGRNSTGEGKIKTADEVAYAAGLALSSAIFVELEESKANLEPALVARKANLLVLGVARAVHMALEADGQSEASQLFFDRIGAMVQAVYPIGPILGHGDLSASLEAR